MPGNRLNSLRSVLAVVLMLFPFVAAATERVLIIGGAGTTGSAVAKLLVARGHKVTAFVRPNTNRSRLEGVPVDFVVGDAMVEDNVAAALEGKAFTVIIDTVEVLEVTDQKSYTRMYGNFVPRAKRMGVKQFLIVSGGCNDWRRENCPLSDPLWAVTKDQTIAEYILRGSGVPYTVFRTGALMPGGIDNADAERRTGTSYLTTDLSKFGAVWRGDLNDQIVGCVGNDACIDKIFAIDDPTMKPMLDHWLCKRRHETDKIILSHPRCGDLPSLPPFKARAPGMNP